MQKNIDSLDYYKTEGNFIAYFLLLYNIESDLYSNPINGSNITDYNIYYDTFIETQELDKRQNLRDKLMYHAFFIKKTVGYREAIPYYLLAHKSLVSLDSIDNYSWYIENELGNSYARLGDYNRAQYYYRLVEKYLLSQLNVKNNKINLARLATNQGICYKSEDLFEKAINKFKTAYMVARSENLNIAILSNAKELASTYVYMHKIDSANYYYDIAFKTFKKELDIEAYFIYLSNLYKIKSSILVEEQNLDKSIEYLIKSEEALNNSDNKNLGRSFAKLYFQFAEVHFKNKSINESEQYLHKGLNAIIPSFSKEQILPNKAQIHRENTFFEILEQYAKLYRTKFKLESKTAFLDSALYCIDLAYIANDKLREKYTDNTASLISISTNKRLFNQSIQTVYQLYSLSKNYKYIEKALELSDRSKGLLLKKKIKGLEVLNKLSTEEKQDLAIKEQNLIQLYQTSYQSNVINDSIYLKIENLKKEINLLLASSLENEDKPIDKSYIEYIITNKHVYTLDNFQGKISFNLIGLKKDLFTLLDETNSLLLNKKPVKSNGEKLFKFLFPNSSIIPRSFVIIPDDRLASFPFEILINDEKLLIENHQLSYVYHKSQLSPSIPKFGDKNVICILPKYDKAPNIDMAMNRNKLYHLDYASKEVEQIKYLYDNVNLISKVSKATLPTFIKGINILHFAGHAKAMDEVAYLAFDSSNKHDARWYDYEIAETRNTMDLVVLSACETGVGKYNDGEGIQSLGRSFQASGTKACLMSLWNVNDKATSEIITSFYKYLINGENKAKALQKAKLDYINNATPAMASPYYWSGFVLVGNINPLFNGNKWYLGLPFLLFLTLLTIISIYLYKKHKKQYFNYEKDNNNM